MKSPFSAICVGLIAFGLLFAACAAPAAPTPVAPAPPKATAAPTAAAPQVSADQAAWDQVIAAAKKEGKVNAYSFHLIGDVGIGIAKAFKDKYGIDVEIVAGPGMQLIQRIQSEQRAGQGSADFYSSGASVVFVAKNQGLTQGVGALPVLQQQGVWTGYPPLDPDRNVLNFMLTAMLPVINTTLVKPQDEPTSWADLLGPQWKGKMSIADPATIPNANYIYVVLNRNGTAKDYFTKLAQQNMTLVGTTRDISASVSRGEVSLAFGASDGSTSPFALEGAPIKAVDMKEGIPISSGGAVAMVAQAPHPNATRLFINWLLSQEGQAAYTKLDPRLPVRSDVADPRAPSIRLSPKVPIVMTGPDEDAVGSMMSNRDLSKLMFGK